MPTYTPATPNILVVRVPEIEMMTRRQRRELAAVCRQQQLTTMVATSKSLNPRWFAPYTIPTR